MGSETMKKEYDFSKGVRGKFFHPDAETRLPVYLEPDNLTFVEKIAREKNEDISKVVNDLIRSDRKIADIVK